MATETERKFLVSGEDWKEGVTDSYLIKQGYVTSEKAKSVRVRLRSRLTADASAEAEAFLTLKFGATAITMDEFEYSIPYPDALEILAHAGTAVVEKVRHIVPHGGRAWEVDVFEGKHAGLIVAEIEGDDVESLDDLPKWVGKEVTEDSYFKNAALALTEKTWTDHLELVMIAEEAGQGPVPSAFDADWEPIELPGIDDADWEGTTPSLKPTRKMK